MGTVQTIEDRLDSIERTLGVLIDLTAVTAADASASDDWTDEGVRRVADAIAERIVDLAEGRDRKERNTAAKFDRLEASIDRVTSLVDGLLGDEGA